MRKFLRKVELVFNQRRTITDLRMAFFIQRRENAELAWMDLQVYNLSMGETPLRPNDTLRLTAGYEGDVEVLFDGVIIDMHYYREGVDVITDIRAMDTGTPAVRNKVNVTFKSQSSVKDIIRRLAEMVTLPIGELDIPDSAINRAWSFDETFAFALTSLGRSFNFDWEIRHGQLLVRDRRRAMDVNLDRRHVFSALNGLVESPTVTAAGVDAKVLLNPSVWIGDEFYVESIGAFDARGPFLSAEAGSSVEKASHLQRVRRVEHVGDTHGEAWFTTVSGLTKTTGDSRGLT